MPAWRDAAEPGDSPCPRQNPGTRRPCRALRETPPAAGGGLALTVRREPGGPSAPFLYARESQPHPATDLAGLRLLPLRSDSPGSPADSVRDKRCCKQSSQRLLTVPAVLTSPDFAT